MKQWLFLLYLMIASHYLTAQSISGVSFGYLDNPSNVPIASEFVSTTLSNSELSTLPSRLYFPMANGSVVNVVEFQQEQFLLFPNPFTQSLTFNQPFTGSIAVYDQTGKVVFTDNGKTPMQHIDLSHLAEGVYNARLMNEQNSISQTIRLIKQ